MKTHFWEKHYRITLGKFKMAKVCATLRNVNNLLLGKHQLQSVLEQLNLILQKRSLMESTERFEHQPMPLNM